VLRVSLRAVDDESRAALEALRVSEDQGRFVDGVRLSLEEAASYEPRPWCRGIYADEVPVGFVMLADDDPTCPWPYFLWRLLIDERYQGRGYGRAAVELVVDYVRSRPGAVELMTSVASYGDEELDRASPLGFYLRAGFERTGEVMDREIVLRRVLNT
jgi:diamine N-acetyltransferase